jgi:hypothetical protein
MKIAVFHTRASLLTSSIEYYPQQELKDLIGYTGCGVDSHLLSIVIPSEFYFQATPCIIKSLISYMYFHRMSRICHQRQKFNYKLG